MPGEAILLGAIRGSAIDDPHAAGWSAGCKGRYSAYISGEESAEQTKLRADRLKVRSGPILLAAETELATILAQLELTRPQVAVIDSIQTVYDANLSSAPGTVTQIRECASRLIRYAKQTGAVVFLVGHVTKDGAIAGPRVLEHMVDAVLYFEGERHQSFRVLRGVKNRFGSTNEIGVFQMGEAGLREVENPSELFLGERPIGVAGSVVVAAMEGTRPILVELQALVAPSTLGTPRRMTSGVDNSRVAMILLCWRRLGCNCSFRTPMSARWAASRF